MGEENSSISSGDSGEEEDFDKIYDSHIGIQEEDSSQTEEDIKSTEPEVCIETPNVESFGTFSDTNNFREGLLVI